MSRRPAKRASAIPVSARFSSSLDGGKGSAHGKKVGDFADAQSADNSGNGTGTGTGAGSGEALAKADPSSSLEAALAALGYGQIASAPATPSGSATPTPASSASSQAGKLVGRTALAGASTLGSAVGSASDGADAQSWDISGAVPLKNLLASDSSLGLQSFQPKTHLAVADAIPVKSGAAVQRRAGSASSTSSTSQVSPASSAPGARASVAPESVPAANPFGGSGANDAASGRGSGGAAARSASDAPAAIAAADVSATASVSTGDPGQAAASVSLDDLPDFIAEQASAMTTASQATTPLSAPQAVKELEISLDPADLGSVSLKLRLTGGKLTVVIGVSNASTLASIENDREAIATRLGVDPQSADSLIIQAQGGSQTYAGGNDAADPYGYGQGAAADGGAADSASGRSGRAGADAQNSQASGAGSGGSGASSSNLAGDLLV